jgi:hypothetical protein
MPTEVSDLNHRHELARVESQDTLLIADVNSDDLPCAFHRRDMDPGIVTVAAVVSMTEMCD